MESRRSGEHPGDRRASVDPMSRVGGPLIDIATMSSGERRRFLRTSGRIRLAKGIYIRSDDWTGLGRREQAVARIVAAAASAGTLIPAGKSAALIHGMPLAGFEDAHPLELATYGATRGGRAGKGTIYRHLSLPQAVAAENVTTGFGEVRVTGPAATGLDLARWHGLKDAVRCLDFALAEGLAEPADLRSALAAAARVHGIRHMRDAAALSTPWSGSPRESDLKVELWRAGLPAPLQQVSLYDHRGNFVARLDFFWPEIGFGVEYDGRGKFSGGYGIPAGIAAQDDLLRQHRIVNLGVLPFRVNNDNYLDGTAVPRIVSMYRRVAERGVPLDPALWRGGGPAWSAR